MSLPLGHDSPEEEQSQRLKDSGLLVGTGADKAELYITGDEETLLDFCLEEMQSDGDNIVGTVARFCSATEEKEADKNKEEDKDQTTHDPRSQHQLNLSSLFQTLKILMAWCRIKNYF